jgi:hypothetical protein
MKHLFTLLLISGLFGSLIAQRNSCRHGNPDCSPNRSRSADRLHFQLGGAANYTYGALSENSQAFDQAYVNGQADAFLGIRLQPRQRRRSNVIGVWGTAGLHNAAAMDRLLAIQGINEALDPGTDLYEFREWEVGFLFKEWFRVSGGQGYQRLVNDSQQEIELEYYTASAGFSWNLSRSIKWNTTANLRFGQDFQQVAFRPSTGLSFRFNFL